MQNDLEIGLHIPPRRDIHLVCEFDDSFVVGRRRGDAGDKPGICGQGTCGAANAHIA
jgi:hypothetical protein